MPLSEDPRNVRRRQLKAAKRAAASAAAEALRQERISAIVQGAAPLPDRVWFGNAKGTIRTRELGDFPIPERYELISSGDAQLSRHLRKLGATEVHEIGQQEYAGHRRGSRRVGWLVLNELAESEDVRALIVARALR